MELPIQRTQLKQQITELKKQVSEYALQVQFKNSKIKQQYVLYTERWKAVKQIMRVWKEGFDPSKDLWESIFSNSKLDIKLATNPTVNTQILENFNQIWLDSGDIIIYCCPAFEVDGNGAYLLDEKKVFDDIGKAGLSVVKTMELLFVLKERVRIRIIMPVNEVEATESNVKALESTAGKVCKELTNMGFRAEPYLSKDFYQAAQINELLGKLSSVADEIIANDIKIQVKFASMVRIESADGNTEAKNDLLLYIAETILLAQAGDIDPQKSIIINTENYKTPELAMMILEIILTNSQYVEKVFDQKKPKFIPILMAQIKSKYIINDGKKLYQERQNLLNDVL
jgi:hypothetical protein